uniref:E-beta-farnesene synthase n=1 Tax=Tanacetum cinerariifolium TaxID=118510 RepID=A0A699HPW6_TANCI|nr:hypothetical protein [Tanacetum cinerariifolium]
MAEENVPAPTRINAQLVHVKARLPIRKTFTASADVPSIYVQQFWNTLGKDTKSGEFSFQLDELWFNLNGDLIRNALGITLKEFTHPFVPPPDDGLLIEFTNNLGYPEELHFVSKMCVNSLYQPWNYYQKYLEIAARKPRQPTTMTGEEVEMKKKASKAGKSKQHAPAKQPKPAKKKSSKPTPSKKSPKERDFTNDADMEQSNSETDTKILKVEEEQGKEVSNIVALDETTIKLDEGQAGSNPEEELGKANMETEVESMVTVPIYQASSLVLLLSTPIIDLSPPKPVVYKMENHDLYSKIEKQVNEVIKEAVHNALQALLHKRFRDLSKFQMKEILHDRMFKSNSYRLHLDHTTLYETLKVSMQQENNDELHAALTKSRKRRRDNQDPPPPPSKDFYRSKKKKHDFDVCASKQPPVRSLQLG